MLAPSAHHRRAEEGRCHRLEDASPPSSGAIASLQGASLRLPARNDVPLSDDGHCHRGHARQSAHHTSVSLGIAVTCTVASTEEPLIACVLNRSAQRRLPNGLRLCWYLRLEQLSGNRGDDGAQLEDERH